MLFSAFGSYSNGECWLTTYGQNNFFETTRTAAVWPGDMIGYEEVDRRDEGLEMYGRIPLLIECSGQVGERVNRLIDNAVAAKVASARESRARSIYFNFETYFSSPHVSIILKSTAASASSKTEVTSINFNINSGEQLSVSDIVGTHVVQLAEGLLEEMIRRNPERYNPSFSGMRRNQAFSVTNRQVVFWFDEFQLTQGSDGIVPLTLRMSNINTVTINRDEVRVRPGFNIKMVPVGRILNGLGYSTSWDGEARQVRIYTDSSRDEFIMELTVGQNNYLLENRLVRSLEAAPEHVNDRVFVPISFFDQIMSLIAYNINNNGSITFASYPVADEWFDR